MITVLLPLLLAQAAAAQSAGRTAPDALSPAQIAAAAPAGDWRAIAAEDLLVMDLAPGADGRARRVAIQLMPAPFSQGWVANIRLLARARWWDGLSVNRVQDNYVAQWGDASEKKPLPAGLGKV
ncbi:peptidylprolyl isomerase, partial [uncultured Sphingomonas sp.]|uniref:peptidylprolyl isomerase n=1 Tax=uncultured Sphingomonas sp. TaxID=158754 RepID=UPI0035CB987B